MASRFRKAVVPVGLGCIIAASLTACGSDDSDSDSTGNTSANSPQSSSDGQASLESASKALSAMGLNCVGPAALDTESAVSLQCTDGPQSTDIRLNLKKDVPNATEAARTWFERIEGGKVDDESLLQRLIDNDGTIGVLETADVVGSCYAAGADQCTSIATENGWTYASAADLAKELNESTG